MKKVVVALGGNAILKKGEEPNITNQIRNIHKACLAILDLIKKNQVIITHGNGPQAGYLLIQQKAPLDVIDAETEGQIGYLIQQELFNILKRNKIKKNIVTLLTRVLVNHTDKAFSNPDKFVGPFYSKSQAQKLKNKFDIKQDYPRGWRRVVPSPEPKKIMERDIIKEILNKNTIVIATGGGGIPTIEKKGITKGVEAVIDKDLASACLGNSINADQLIIITDVDGVYLNYGNKSQKKIKNIKSKEIKKYYRSGYFPSGSMGPKVQAAINFIENGGKKVIITNVTNLKKGTIITK